MDNNSTTAGFGDFSTSIWSVGGTNWTTNDLGTGPLTAWDNTSGATTIRSTGASAFSIRVEDNFTVSSLISDGVTSLVRLGRGTAGDPNPTVSITVQDGGEVFVDTGKTLQIGNTNVPVSLGGSFTKTGAGILLFNNASGQIGAANITIEQGTMTTATNTLGSTTNFALNGGNLIIQAGIRTIGSLSGTSGDVITVTGSSPGALTITQTTDGVFAGGIGPNGTNTRSVTKAGAATLTLTGSNTYDGTTTINAGTLTLNRATGSLPTGSPLTMRGGTFNMDNIGAVGALSQNLGALTFNLGDSTVRTTRTAAQDQALIFSSLATRTAGATGNFISGGGPNSATNGFNLTGVAAGFINRGIFYDGSAYAWMDGTGTFVRAISYGSDTGAVTSSGAASLTGVAHQQITGAITAQNTATFTTLNIAGNHNFTLAAGQTLTVSGLLKTGNAAGGATISGGTDIRAGGGGEFVIRTDGANDALTISSTIASTNNLTKSGAGTLVLSGANTYTGETRVGGGTLSIGANVNLGAQATGATLNLSGGTLQATATFGLFNGTPGTNNRAVVLTNIGTFDVTSANTLTVAGVVSGAEGSLNKANTGTLALTGANTYAGSTTVSGGTLLINGTGAINSTSGIAVNTGGTFRYDSSTGLTRNVTLNSGGTFAHNGSTNYTGTLTWNGGTLAGTNYTGINLSVGSGQTLSPGNSPDTMVTASETWTNGGNFNLEIHDFDLAPGTGFDTIAITGTLDLTGLTAGGFNINLWSLSSIGPDVDGDALNFNNAAPGAWLIVSTTGGISGFDENKFTINTGAFNATSGFSNALGGGTFKISHADDNLYLDFIPIPEPSSALLLGLGLAPLVFRNRKRR